MLARLRRRLGQGADDALLNELLAAAGEVICAYTARERVPEALSGAQIELAVLLYNRRGMEGECAHAEGGLSCTAESLPELLRRQLNPYRRARTVSE